MAAFEQLRAARLWVQRFAPWLLEVEKPPARKRRIARRPAPAVTKAARHAPPPAERTVPRKPPTAAPAQARSSLATAASLPNAPVGGLAALAERYQACLRCRRYRTRTMVVFGRGSEQADLLMLAAAPSAQADQSGELSVGAAGRLLERMVERGMELPIESVYLTTLVKCHGGEEARLLDDEVAACSELLRAQLACVRPRVLCVLGEAAAQALLQTAQPLEELRGQWHSYAGLPLRVSYHPGWLESLSPEEARPAKRKAWDDLKAVVQRVAATRGGTLLPW